MQWTIGIIALVVVGIGVLVVAKMATDTDSAVSTAAKPAPASIATDLAAVPVPAIAAAGENEVRNRPQPADEEARTEAGKPLVTYIGAEFCPFCAGERWALTVALSQFGEFSGLKTIHSSEGDVPTLSYVGSTYTSDYLAFNPIEMQDQNRRSLETPSDAEMELFQRLGGGSFPFIDFGGTAYQKGGAVEVTTLVGKDQVDIAAALAASTPEDTDQTKLEGNINAVAAGYIRTICGLTDNQPANVCKAIAGA